jgi:Tol biopolymer transport system component
MSPKHNTHIASAGACGQRSVAVANTGAPRQPGVHAPWIPGAGSCGQSGGLASRLPSCCVRVLILTLATLLVSVAASAPYAWAEECPNAAFRLGSSAHLPDCRAYELVTPPFKNAGDLTVENYGPEGSSLRFASNAAFAGLEGFPDIGLANGAEAYYSVSRTASGWTTVPDDPPSTEYLAVRPYGFTDFAGASLDQQTTVWMERKVGQPENDVGIFLRRPDRSIVEVGPALPPTGLPGSPEEVGGAFSSAQLYVVGHSADASHVFFSLSNDFWPFDSTEGGRTTREGSLYEYIGVGNTTPMLVGVSDGSTVIDGRTLPAGELISRCGMVLKGLSADGEVVFFTPNTGCAGAPAVKELFARVDNGLPGARTVAISEPTEEDCSACYENGKLASAGQLANAVFLGASEDGSKVFFETAQPLLGGDSSSNIYEYDFDAPAGERIVRVSGGDATAPHPTADVLSFEPTQHEGDIRISADGSHVYFIAGGVLTKTPNQQGEAAEAGLLNLYVFERDAEYPSGRVTFIARLSPRDLGNQEEAGFRSSVTPDGRFLAFTSNRDLTPDDTSTTSQVFEYDAQTGVLVRVSIGQDGFNDDGNTPANSAVITYGEHNPGGRVPYGVSSVSADGSYVFFESYAALTPQALEGFNNVYEYHDGQVSLISDGQDIATVSRRTVESVVELIGTDASGDDVFFTTADRLVGQDTDDNVDVYDARIDGGFPAPAVPPPCEGEGCQGKLGAAPTLLSPGSEFQAGGSPPLASSPAAQPSAKKSKPKKKKKKRKAAGAKRRARGSRRASDKRRAKS